MCSSTSSEVSRAAGKSCGAFEKAGLGDPVALDLDGRRVVVEAVNRMLDDEEVGEGEVDPQLRKLAGYLRDELPEE